MVVEYLFQCGKVPTSFIEVSPQWIRNHVVEKWNRLKQKYIHHIWSNCNTKACQKLLLVQRRTTPSFDIPVKMQPLETDGHNVLVICDSSPDNKRMDQKSTSPPKKSLLASSQTSILITNSPPSVGETSSHREEKDYDSAFVIAANTERHSELPTKEKNTNKGTLKNRTCVPKRIGNKSFQREKSDLMKGDNTVDTKTKRRRVTLPMSSTTKRRSITNSKDDDK